MTDDIGWRVTQDDSEDLGFALSCLVNGAITLEEFKGWVYLVLEESDEFPDYLIDLSDVADKRELTMAWRDLIGFWPESPLSRSEEKSLVGIAYARFPGFRDDRVRRDGAAAALRRADALRARFRRSFPTIDIPDDREGVTDRAALWRLAGVDRRPLTISEVQTLLVNRLATREQSTTLESDAGLTLHLVTNRRRVMVRLTGPGDAAGHAIDPEASGTSAGYLLDNGQEDVHPDRDTVTIPRALDLVGHILAHDAPPQDGWIEDVPGTI